MSHLAKLHDLTLSILYKLHRENSDYVSIRRELERRHLPSLTDEQIDMFKKEFKEKELKYPQTMRRFREMLKIKE